MLYRTKLATVATFSLLASSCAWVKPLPQSHSVALLQPNEIVNCVKKGTTQSKTLAKIMFIPRSAEKIKAELVTLAKNEAAIMGGDGVVAESELSKGGQLYGVYFCHNH